MAGKLHAAYVKIVAAGGDLDAATQLKIAENAVNHKCAGRVIAKTAHDNPNPIERYESGAVHELKFVLLEFNHARLLEIIGGSEVSGVYTKTQSIRILLKYDIRVAVYRETDALLIFEDWTDMNIMPEVQEDLQTDKMTLLPVTAMSTSTSDWTSDNSAT
jgi:hypothetical protein